MLPSGQHEITVTLHGFHVKTLLPVGFPVASPAYFWALPDDDWIVARFNREKFRFSSLQYAPNGELLRWWIYKPSEWNPNTHTVLTWLHQINAVIGIVASDVLESRASAGFLVGNEGINHVQMSSV